MLARLQTIDNFLKMSIYGENSIVEYDKGAYQRAANLRQLAIRRWLGSWML
jgi:hypothetical protein